jgi:hypothetical protein
MLLVILLQLRTWLQVEIYVADGDVVCAASSERGCLEAIEDSRDEIHHFSSGRRSDTVFELCFAGNDYGM